MEENTQQDINVLIKRRYEELEELKEKGIEQFVYSYNVNSDSDDIKENYSEEKREELLSLQTKQHILSNE